jgi:flagellar motor switch protein FliN
MTDIQPTPSVKRFCDIWKENFTTVLGQVGVTSPVASLTEIVPAAALPEDAEKNIVVRFSTGGVLKGDLVWFAEKPVALRFAQLLMSEPGDPAVEFIDTHRDAFAELLRQVAGLVASAGEREFGGETQISFEAAPEAAFVPAQSVNVTFAGEKLPEVSLGLLLNAELCESLSALPVDPQASSEAQTDSPQAPALTGLPSNLDLLLDVELEATIRFGERDMLLRDIFGLMPGTVVELNQLVNEPADLLVAGRLIARGEVVVVDGNFGLRVSEVASPGQRAELLQM